MKLRRDDESFFRSKSCHHQDIHGRRARSRSFSVGEYAFDRKVNCSRFYPYPLDLSKAFQDAAHKCPSVSIREEVMEGQPCITGTRIPVRSVLRAVERSGSVEGVLAYYPQLNSQQVKDALYFSQVILEIPSGIDEIAAVD